MPILGCYNDGRKKIFNLLFIFLSLFSWTPRDRLVNDSGALHCGESPQTMRAKDFDLSLLPFPARDRFIVEDSGSPLWRVATDNACQRLLLVVTSHPVAVPDILLGIEMPSSTVDRCHSLGNVTE